MTTPSTSRHSALSELMVQNAELRSELGAWHTQFGAQLSHAVEERDRLKEQLRVLQSAYDSLSQMKEKAVASRIETDELRDELEQCRKDMKIVVDNSSNLTKEQEQGLRAQLKEAKAKNARLRSQLEQEIVQHAGCLTAAEGCTKDPAIQGQYGWSLAYQRTLELRLDYEHLKAENARLAARIIKLQGFVGPPTQWSKSLSDLLAPTIAALEAAQVLGFDRAIVRKELDRLRGMVERKV